VSSSQDAYGLKCPRCECRHLDVLETRRHWNNSIKRYRRCRNCGKRFTTIELDPHASNRPAAPGTPAGRVSRIEIEHDRLPEDDDIGI